MQEAHFSRIGRMAKIKILLIFTLVTTIHYSHSMFKRKTVCEKIQSDIIKTTTDLKKNLCGFKKS